MHHVLNREYVLSGSRPTDDRKLHLRFPHLSEEFVYREIWFDLKHRATVICGGGILRRSQGVAHMNYVREGAVLICDQDSKVPTATRFVLHIGHRGRVWHCRCCLASLHDV